MSGNTKWVIGLTLAFAATIWLYVVIVSEPAQAEVNDWRQEYRARQARARPPTPPATPVAVERPWYSGGTLHDKTIRDWAEATPRNRLATAGDMITGIQLDEYGVSSDPNGSRIKLLAMELHTCVDEATDGLDLDAHGMGAKDVAEVAATCLVLMWGETPPPP